MEKFGGPAPVNETTASGLVRLGGMKKRMTVLPTEQQQRKAESGRERERREKGESKRKQWTQERKRGESCCGRPRSRSPQFHNHQSTATRPRLSQAGPSRRSSTTALRRLIPYILYISALYILSIPYLLPCTPCCPLSAVGPRDGTQTPLPRPRLFVRSIARTQLIQPH